MRESATVISINPLIELSDDLQTRKYPTETEWFLSSQLYQSFEAWGEALQESELNFYSEKIYWLAYTSYHFADALLLISKEAPEGLQGIHNTMKTIMEDHAPSKVEVQL